MTASIKNREDKLCDREDYVEDQEIKLENKEVQLNQLRNTGSERTKSEPEKDRLKRTTVSYLTGRTDDKEQRLPRCSQELREQRRGYRRL